MLNQRFSLVERALTINDFPSALRVRILCPLNDGPTPAKEHTRLAAAGQVSLPFKCRRLRAWTRTTE